MVAEPKIAAEVSWAQVHAFRLARHHLAKREPKKELTRVVGDIGGVQAQLMSAAEMQVGVRVNCKTEDVATALWKNKTLAKTWLMRGTLHLIPAGDLPLYTAVACNKRLSSRWRGNAERLIFEQSGANLRTIHLPTSRTNGSMALTDVSNAR